jgi:sterol 3beta-glucosyltransferase
VTSLCGRHQADRYRFWGDSIHRAGAGPAPVPPKRLNAETLAEAINTALDPQVKEMAEKIGENIRAEQGELKGVESFHRHLPLLNMRYGSDCDIADT